MLVAPPVEGAGRAFAVVVAALFLSGAFAGCVGKEELGRASGRVDEDNELEQTFSVPKGTDRIVARIETDPSAGGGSVNVVMAPLDIEASMGSAGLAAVAAGENGRVVVDDPRSGTWFIGAESEDGYSGDVRIVVTSEGGALFSIGGSFWDILGVVLALAIALGGLYLYRRRSRFLSRELHRIDETVKLFGDDVEECRTHIKDLLVKRKIQESQYIILEKRIERYLSDLATPGNRHKARPGAAESDLELE